MKAVTSSIASESGNMCFPSSFTVVTLIILLRTAEGSLVLMSYLRADMKQSDIPSCRSLLVVEERMSIGCVNRTWRTHGHKTLHQLPLMERTFILLLFLHRRHFSSCLRRTWWDRIQQDARRGRVNGTSTHPGSHASRPLSWHVCVCVYWTVWYIGRASEIDQCKLWRGCCYCRCGHTTQVSVPLWSLRASSVWFHQSPRSDGPGVDGVWQNTPLCKCIAVIYTDSFTLLYLTFTRSVKPTSTVTALPYLQPVIHWGLMNLVQCTPYVVMYCITHNYILLLLLSQLWEKGWVQTLLTTTCNTTLWCCCWSHCAK